jgi:hypothetical protein
MSSAVVVERPAIGSPTYESGQLDEALWQAWLAKGRDQERRTRLAANKAVRWGSMIALLVAAALGAQLTPYEVVARFVVAVGAVAMMIQTLRERQFAFAAAFGLIATLFNPVAAVVGFSGGWERVFAAASAIPFIAPLIWGNGKQARHA